MNDFDIWIIDLQIIKCWRIGSDIAIPSQEEKVSLFQ